MELVLASSSPRRKEILGLMRAKFSVIPSDADEKVPEGTPPADAVLILASRKGAAVLRDHPELRGAFILASDTVVDLDGQILGKPKNADDAVRMLSRLSGRTHLVHSGICVFHEGKSAGVTETTTVRFAPLSRDEIEYYVSSGEPFGKAGSYAIQGLGARYVSGISGDYFNVMGLPVYALDALLRSTWQVSLRDFN